MSEMMIYIGFAMTGAALMLALLGLVIAAVMPAGDRWSKRFFIVFFILLLLYVCFVMAEEIISIRPGMQTVLVISGYFETLFASVMIPMITVYLLHSCGEKWTNSTLFRAVAVMWAVSFVLLNMSVFTDWFYHITPENQFVRGPLYPLMVAALVSIMALTLAGVFRRRNRMPRRYFYAFLVGLFPITLAMLIHFFVTVFSLLGFGVAICALSMFGIILVTQVEQLMQQEREIAHQRASIMVLQMRPHFIYNTMMSIYYLCKQNPDLAQRVTLDFTTYLRKNFTAIASEKLIPFSEELEHTRAYLAVEQAQFEGSLFIEYDTPHTDFRLPPLTLQPIVENAVKHGMDPDAEPLRILIRTMKTYAGNEIVVENTGAAFEPANDNEPHIALKNIQQRLEMMCRGEMTILPRGGGGTVVRVTIP